MSKIVILYHSEHHQNTRTLLQHIAAYEEVQLIEVTKATPRDIKDADILGFASGIYMGKHHASIFECINNLPANQLAQKATFVLSTSGSNNAKYNQELLTLLNQKGAIPLGDFHCAGYDTYGVWKIVGGISKHHPNDADKKNALNFIQQIKCMSN